MTTSKYKHSLRESWWDIGFDYDIGGVKSKETRSYQKGKCHSPIFSRAAVGRLGVRPEAGRPASPA